MSYQVKLDTFEGPLDLLLYLIRKNDMDIRDIEISKITHQYLDFVNAMRNLDVDLASEFIVMAATLIYIKSKMLLPEPEMEGEEEGMDPKEALIQRLIEYQQYKMVAQELSKKPLLNVDLFKVALLPEHVEKSFDPKEQLIEVGIYELSLVFQGMLARTKKVVHHIEGEQISIEEKIAEIVDHLNQKVNSTLEFKSLFSEVTTRAEIVICFLAILELTRLKYVKLFQTTFDSEIHLKVTENILNFHSGDIRVSQVTELGEGMNGVS